MHDDNGDGGDDDNGDGGDDDNGDGGDDDVSSEKSQRFS